MLSFTPEEIATLAELYDRFNHALDPDAPERDQAEKAFGEILSDHYEALVHTLKHQHVQEGGHVELFACPVSERDFRREVLSSAGPT